MEAMDGSMGFDFAGTYTRIIEHKLISYAFGDRKAEVEFIPGANGVTFDSEPTHSVEQQQGGWQAILNNFAPLRRGQAEKGVERIAGDQADAEVHRREAIAPSWRSSERINITPSVRCGTAQSSVSRDPVPVSAPRWSPAARRRCTDP
jgi:hypothetical protein